MKNFSDFRIRTKYKFIVLKNRVVGFSRRMKRALFGGEIIGPGVIEKVLSQETLESFINTLEAETVKVKAITREDRGKLLRRYVELYNVGKDDNNVVVLLHRCSKIFSNLKSE